MGRETLPIADPSRASFATGLFSEGQTAEEFAARNAHTIGCFSLDECRYADPRLDAWVVRLGQILRSEPGVPTVAELRARFLTPEERARFEAEEQESL